jgi:hypothetical protein
MQRIWVGNIYPNLGEKGDPPPPQLSTGIMESIEEDEKGEH